MKPTNDALQVFYGTLPLIGVVIAAWMRESMLLKDILKRLAMVEQTLSEFKGEVHKELGGIKERLSVLETRAGIIFHG